MRQVLNLLFTSRHCWGKCQSKVCFALYSQIYFVIKRLKVLRSWSLAMWHPKASVYFASTTFSSSVYKSGGKLFKGILLTMKIHFLLVFSIPCVKKALTAIMGILFSMRRPINKRAVNDVRFSSVHYADKVYIIQKASQLSLWSHE